MAEPTDLGGIKISVSVDSTPFYSGINKIQDSLATLETKAGKSFSTVSAKTIALGNIFAKVASKIASTIASNIDYAVKRLDSLNRFPIAMQNLGIATKESSAAIQSLANYTLGLPTTLNDAAEKVQYFTSATNNVWTSIKIFKALNDAVVSGAQNTQVQSTAIEQWSQAIVRGSFDVEQEFNSLVVANAKAVNEIAENLLGAGKDFNDLYAALKDGTVSVYDVISAMIDLDENGTGSLESWSKRAQNSVAGIDTAITRFKTNIGKAVAEVANEIGWKNIYTAINNIGDAIYRAGQVAAAVVRILKQLFSWISAIFGGKGSTNEVVKEAEAASDGMSGVASGASDAADSLDDAVGSAKKLNKQLASFDEMNVLKESTSGNSGSSGGANGGFGDLNYNWDGSGLEEAQDKIAKIVDQIKAKFNEIFSDVDFSSLEKSFEHLLKSIKKFGSGAGKILKDFLKNYLTPMAKWTIGNALPRFLESTASAMDKINWDKIREAFNGLWEALVPFSQTIGEGLLWFYDNVLLPFGTWVANDAVPAFLNALSGAIELLTGIIQDFAPMAESLWNDFLGPIVEWTGGIIVTVLNGIGDALHWIASNQVAVDLITALTAGVLGAIAAYETYQFIMGVVNALQLVFNGAMVAGTTASGAYAAGVGLVSAAQSACTAATGLLNTALSMLPFVVIAGAIAGVVFALKELTGQQGDTEKSTEELRGEMSDLERKIDDNHDGVISLTEALDGMRDAQLALSDATIARIRAEEKLEETTKKYQPVIDELKKKTELTSDEQKTLEKAEAELENASIRLKIAISNENTEKDNSAKTTRLAAKEMIAGKTSVVAYQTATNLASGSFKNLSEALKDAIDKNDTWADSLGETHKFTQSEINELVTKVLTSSEELNAGVTYEMDRMTGDVKKILTSMTGSSYNDGYNYDSGLARGISENSYLVTQATWRLSDDAFSTFKGFFNIKSPSRLMKKQGGFVAEGVAIGILDKVPEVTRAVTELADIALDSFDNVDARINLSSIGNGLSDQITGLLDIEAEQTPVHVIVNVGEDTMIDKLIKGTNDLAFMQNRAVLNV